MKRLAKIIEEWEKTTLLLSAVAVAIFFLILFLPSDQEGNISQQSTLPATPNYVQTKNMSFLEPARLEQTVNPMAFRRKKVSDDKEAAKVPPKTPQTTKKEPDKGQSGKVSTTQQPTQQTQKTTQQPAQQPAIKPQQAAKKEPARVLTLTYRGIYKGLQGNELAFLRSSDSNAKNKVTSFTLQKGEKAHDLFTIVSFDENNLTLLGPKEKTLTIPRNKDTKVTIE